MERRNITTEVRVIERDDGPPQIEGLAAVFNRDSLPLAGGMFIERIKPGFFRNVLKDDIKALFNHDRNIVLGRIASGTLEVRETKDGLHMSVTPPDTNLVRDMVLTPIKRGDVTGQSFGFGVKEDEWETVDKGPDRRTLVTASQLFDVGPVTDPAYPDTDVAVRSMETWRSTQMNHQTRNMNRRRLLDLAS